MNTYSGPALAAALIILLSTGCARHDPAPADAATTTTTTTTAADPAATTAATADTTTTSSDEDKPGGGHVSITGEYALEKDIVVDTCAIGPPGEGLLAGYHMGIKGDEPPIAMLAIALKDFAKDGRYEQPSPSAEAAVGQAMRTGTMGPLTLMVMPEPTAPLGFGQVAASTLAITISNDGAKGVAEFTNLESQFSAANIDPATGKMHRGKRISGSVSWTCGHVDRIDPTMNKAVNGMFNKLIPPK